MARRATRDLSPLKPVQLLSVEEVNRVNDVIRKLRAENPESQSGSHRGGWHSPNLIDVPELAWLLLKVQSYTGKNVMYAWAMYFTSGEWMLPHRHGGCAQVAVLMVQQVPEIQQDDGALVVEGEHPRFDTIRLTDGQVVTFDPNRYHMVAPHRYAGPRVTVAFNLK